MVFLGMTKTDISLSRIAEMMEELALYKEQIIVIKIGGNSLDDDPEFLSSLSIQLEFLQSRKIKIVLIHGGGPQIDRALEKKGISFSRRPDGRRITSPEAMKTVALTMSEISHEITKELRKIGCSVLTAAEKNFFFVKAKPFYPNTRKNREEDLTGIPTKVDCANLLKFLNKGKLVVLNSLGIDKHGKIYNINADDFSMAIASALKAKRLIFITNVAGVLDAEKKLLETLSANTAKLLIEKGVISKGMIPKVESALKAIKNGVEGVAIINGHVKWSLLGELLTKKGFGTLVAKD